MADELVVDLVKKYAGGPRIEACLSLPAGGGQVSVLYGPSGSGKTTLLRCLAGLERPEQGSIRFCGETWLDAGRGIHVAPQRRRIGYLSQDYALFPHLSVARNIAYGLGGLRKPEQQRRIEEMLGLFGLEELARRRPSELSGGQQQRAALARAMAPQPRLLLLDEPLSALDAATREHLRVELRHRLRSLGIPTILVSHDRIEVLSLGDTLAVLVDGRVRQTGPVPEVFSRPADALVARAVGVETVLPARILERADGLARVEVGKARLTALDPGELPSEVYVCLRAEDIVLERGPGAESSARNHVQGWIVGLVPEGPLVRVHLDCSFPLVVLITKRSCEELDLHEGQPVTASIKAPSVRLIPRG